MKVVVAAGGRFHSLHLSHQLEKRGVLKKLFTGAYTHQDRNYVSENLVQHYRSYAALDQIFFRLHLSSLIPKSSWYVFKDNFFDWMLRKKIKKLGKVDIFVGWAHYFLNSLSYIRKTGAKIIVESGSCHILEQQKFLCDEYKRWGVALTPISPKNIEKMIKEYEASDYIMIPSDFAYQSFLRQGFSNKKLLKVSYGVDVAKFSAKKINQHVKFCVIFVGEVGLRKGVSYLLKAWEKIKLPSQETELILVGNISRDFKPVLSQFTIDSNVIFYGSVSQEKLKTLYARASLFVLPSIEEGLAMVLGEAMASGLPVICSTNTGGEEFIEDGNEGFIIPIRDSDTLAEKIAWCYDNRDACFVMGKRAQRKVQNFTWDHYGEKIIEMYRKILKQ